MALLEKDISDLDRTSTYYELARYHVQTDSAATMDYLIQAREWAAKVEYEEGDYLDVYIIGRLNAIAGNYQEADSKFSQLIDLAENGGNRKWEGMGYTMRAVNAQRQGDFENSIKDNLIAEKIFVEIDDQIRLADVYNDMSVAHRGQGSLEESLNDNLKALEIYKKLDDTVGLIKSYGNIGIYYNDEGNYSRALEYYLISLQLAEAFGSEVSVALNYFFIGIVYDHLEEYGASRDYYFKGIALFSKLGFRDHEGLSHNYIGTSFSNDGEYDKAQEHLLKAVKMFERTDSKLYLATTYQNLGSNYTKVGDYASALDVLFKSKELFEEIGAANYQVASLYRIGNAYLKSHELQKAKEILTKSLEMSKEQKIPDAYRESAYYLSETENALGNYRAAYHYHVIYKEMYDSLLNEAQTKKITRLQADYEFEKEKDSIAFLQDKAAIAFEQQLENKQVIIQASAMGGILVLIILIVLYRSNLIKRKKNRELNHRNEIIELKNEELTNKNVEITDLREKEKQMADDALAMKERELTTITMLSHEKNTILQNLGDHIGSLTKKVDDRVIPDLEEIKKIIKSNLNEESWSVFMMQFEKVHPKFFSKLKTDFPSLTQYDLRLCSYLKVGMDNKEIARISAVSVDSIKKSIYRLKKKLRLNNEDDIRGFLMRT